MGLRIIFHIDLNKQDYSIQCFSDSFLPCTGAVTSSQTITDIILKTENQEFSHLLLTDFNNEKYVEKLRDGWRQGNLSANYENSYFEKSLRFMENIVQKISAKHLCRPFLETPTDEVLASHFMTLFEQGSLMCCCFDVSEFGWYTGLSLF